ncbi:MAG: type III secretion system chaperone [Desulfomicrobium sp.]|nr:type III secretion system chaperone [Desulfomicrobium sp.]NLV97427.1 type III secretion system chaperone [Desulfovibrionales bacterium]
MNILTNAQNTLNHINQVINGNGLTLDANNVTSFTVDENIICLFCVLEEEQTLVVTLYLGRVEETNAALLHEILCGNYMGAYTAGGTLGIDAEENLLALHHHFPLPIEEPAWIEEQLAGLIGAAQYWRDKLQASAAPITAPSGPMAGIRV